MKWSDLPLRPTPRMLRQFAVAWLLFFAGVGAHQYFVRHHPARGELLAALAVVVGVLGWVKPAAIRWVYVAATVMAFPIGWVVSLVILAMMYYLVLTPVALFFRLRGRDLLRRRKPAAGEAGFWLRKGPPPEPGRYLRQY
jgi:hypothetical protein